MNSVVIFRVSRTPDIAQSIRKQVFRSASVLTLSKAKVTINIIFQLFGYRQEIAVHFQSHRTTL